VCRNINILIKKYAVLEKRNFLKVVTKKITMITIRRFSLNHISRLYGLKANSVNQIK